MDDRDSLVDREIEAALAVEPSPEFVARVRAAVAADEPAPWWLSWKVAVGALATAAVIVIAVMASREPAATTTPAPEVLISSRAPVSPAPVVGAPAPLTRETRLQPRVPTAVRRHVSRAPAKQPSEPEVLVAPEYADGLNRYLASLQRSRFVITGTEPISDVAGGVVELPPSPEIAIAPITIQPLETTGPDKGERQ
jgi:hypothetical protein